MAVFHGTLATQEMGNVVVGKMIVDPAHPDTILAATSGGIYKSTNGAVFLDSQRIWIWI